MFRLLVICAGAVLFSGCASLQDQGLFASSSEFLSRTGDALRNIGKPNAQLEGDAAAPHLNAEVQSLFEQPYIDPLTKYLQQHDGDTAGTDQLARVRQERDRRCNVIAARYAHRSATPTSLAHYRAGYAFSCPGEVAAFAAQVESVQHEPSAVEPQVVSTPQSAGADEATATAPGPDDRRPETASEDASQQLNDCYLLTAIRNFSDALEACRQPAKDGNVRAQTNMAMMAGALENYDVAYRWASEAAPSSADAANLLGELYRQGNGVAQDDDLAEKWFVRAASLGHVGAKARIIDDEDPSITVTSGDHVH